MRAGLEAHHRVETHPGYQPSPRLVKAAQEFEAQMMKELLRPMTGRDAVGEDPSDAGATNAFDEYGVEALGQAISRNGGFGIARQIVQDLSRSGHSTMNGNRADRRGQIPG